MPTAKTPLLGPGERNSEWAFVEKIFLIVFLQLLVASLVATLVLKFSSVADFFKSTWLGLILYILIILLVALALILLICFKDRRPEKNLVLLILFSLALGSAVGLLCAYVSFGEPIKQTLIITALTFVVLIVYSFSTRCVPRIAHDSIPYIGVPIVVILLFVVFQISHIVWMGGLTFNEATLGAVAGIAFCEYMIWRAKSQSVGPNKENYIWASTSVYLDLWGVVPFVINLVKAASGPRR